MESTRTELTKLLQDLALTQRGGIPIRPKLVFTVDSAHDKPTLVAHYPGTTSPILDDLTGEGELPQALTSMHEEVCRLRCQDPHHREEDGVICAKDHLWEAIQALPRSLAHAFEEIALALAQMLEGSLLPHLQKPGCPEFTLYLDKGPEFHVTLIITGRLQHRFSAVMPQITRQASSLRTSGSTLDSALETLLMELTSWLMDGLRLQSLEAIAHRVLRKNEDGLDEGYFAYRNSDGRRVIVNYYVSNKGAVARSFGDSPETALRALISGRLACTRSSSPGLESGCTFNEGHNGDCRFAVQRRIA